MVYPSHSIPIDWHKPYGKTAEQSKSVTQKFNARDFSFTKLQLTTKLKKKRKEEETEAEDGGKLNVSKYKLIEWRLLFFWENFFLSLTLKSPAFNRSIKTTPTKNECVQNWNHTHSHSHKTYNFHNSYR